MKSVTLLGTGTMGAGMAGSLLAAGYHVTVWNRNAERAAPLAALGARVAESPRVAAASAELIIAMLADDDASRAVWLGPEGALAGASAGTIIIESSTLTPAWVRELAAVVEAQHCSFLDAPVTGSRTHAASGQLFFLVGGAADVLERAHSVLKAMSRGMVHLGPIGSGALVKLVNNFVCGVQVAALCEAVALIEKSGIERDPALAVLLEGAPGSPLVKTIAQRMLARDYTVNFSLSLMYKDLCYAMIEAEEHGLQLWTAVCALNLFQRGKDKGLGAQDMSAIIEPLREQRA
jgi:3-hydroxyisobutyrate dehydrogenase